MANTISGTVQAQSSSTSGSTSSIISISGSVTAQSSSVDGDLNAYATISGSVQAQSSSASGSVSVPSVTITGTAKAQNSTVTGNIHDNVPRLGGSVQAQNSTTSGSLQLVAVSVSGTVQAQNATTTGNINDNIPAISGTVQSQDSSVNGSISAIPKISGTAKSGASSSSGIAFVFSNTPERPLTTSVENEALAKTNKVVLMVELLYDSTPLRVWSGYGDLNHFGRTFTGTGKLLNISEIEETNQVKAAKVSLTLSGIPSGLLSDALDNNIRGRPATIWMAFLNSDEKIIDDPVEIVSGKMDTQTIDKQGTSATITVTIENVLIDLFRQREMRYTRESHQLEHPDDTFFDYVAALQNADLGAWGKEERDPVQFK